LLRSCPCHLGQFAFVWVTGWLPGYLAGWMAGWTGSDYLGLGWLDGFNNLTSSMQVAAAAAASVSAIARKVV